MPVEQPQKPLIRARGSNLDPRKMIKRRVKSPDKFETTARPHSSQALTRPYRFSRPMSAVDVETPNNSVLLEKVNRSGEKQFLLAPIQSHSKAHHFVDSADLLNNELYAGMTEKQKIREETLHRRKLYQWTSHTNI